jgi:NADPH:quinone reductase-like Zn-dependent oxidoreductase
LPPASKKIRFLAAKPDSDDLELIVSLVRDEIIKPVIDRYYTLDKTADAMQYLAQGLARGKIVIRV